MKQIKIGAAAKNRRIEGIKAYADVLCITAQNLNGETAAAIVNGVATGGNWTNTIVGTAAGDCYVELTDAELAALSEGDTAAWSCAAVTGQLRVPPVQIVTRFAADVAADILVNPALDKIDGSDMAKDSTVAKEATIGTPSGASVSADIATLAAQVEGQGDRSVTIQIYRTGTTIPIAGAKVTVMNSTDSLFLTLLTTDANGRATMARNDGVYKLRFSCAGATFTNPQTLTVSRDGTYTFYGDVSTIPVPTSGDACTVALYCFKPNSTDPMETVNAKATIVNLPYSYNGKYHSGQQFPGTYDATTGLLTFELVWGAKVAFDIVHISKKTMIRTIPSESTALFSALTE